VVIFLLLHNPPLSQNQRVWKSLTTKRYVSVSGKPLGQNYRNISKQVAHCHHRKNGFCKQELAAELGVSLVTLTDWMKKGLPFLRLHKRVYFKKSEVLKIMTTKN
jgi:hypothetical protein